MATTRVKGLGKLKKRLEKLARDVANRVAMDKTTGKAVRALLVKQIQNKKTLPSDKRVEPLKIKTAKRRRKLAKVNKTHRTYLATKSNMTFTGKFLKSFKTTTKNRTKSVIYVIGPTGKRTGYVNPTAGYVYKSGKKEGKKVPKRGKPTTNEAVGGGLIDSGRDYTVLGPKTTDKLRALLSKRVERALRRRFRGRQRR